MNGNKDFLDASVGRLLEEPVFVKVRHENGDIRLNINDFARMVRSLGKYHSGLTLLLPFAEVYENGVWRKASQDQVLEWAVKQREE